MTSEMLSRRAWLRRAGGAMASCSALSGWMSGLAAQSVTDPRRKRSCILLWMAGGPSQTDTFDLKPGHRNGGPFHEIATAVPGLRIGEHLPRLARCGNRLAVLRSLQSREGDHDRATAHLRTGYRPE